MKKYDLAVIGGGFAGVAAALAAARGGAKVLIVEKSNCLGGAAVNCLVNPFMPFYTEIDGKRVDLSTGIFKEICDGLESRQALSKRSFLEEELKYILNEMVIEANIDLLFHAYIYAVEKNDKEISLIKVATKSGTMCIEANYFIDATGDAQLAYLAECPTVLGREPDHLCQPMTLCFRVGNVDVEKFYASRERLKIAHAQSLAAGELTNPRENILVFKTPIHNVLHFNTTRVVKKDPTSPEEVTEAEVLARQQVYEIYEFMKKHADGLEDSFLMMTAALFALAGGYGLAVYARGHGEQMAAAVLAVAALCALPTLTDEARNNHFIAFGETVSPNWQYTEYTLPGPKTGVTIDSRIHAGEGVEIAQIERDGLAFRAQVSSENGGEIALPLFGYDGYRAELDGQALAWTVGADNRLTVQLPAGAQGEMQVHFAGKAIWRAADAVSLLTAAGLAALAIFRKKKESGAEKR